MTIKEMIKKVETYNEVARTIGRRELKLTMYNYLFIGSSCGTHIDVTDFKALKKWIKEEQIEETAEAILNADYEFETRKDFSVVFTPQGDVAEFGIEFCLWDK